LPPNFILPGIVPMASDQMFFAHVNHITGIVADAVEAPTTRPHERSTNTFNFSPLSVRH
jgi:hypothetical protein